jgi:thiol-disulfide isomerase/thioredoxin
MIQAMKNLCLKICVLIILILTSLAGQSQKIEYIKVPGLERILNNPDNKLFIINFWATWCPPCVKEFPDFEKVSKEYDTTQVKFIMVSLDFPSQVNTNLLPFLKKNKVSLNVAVMTDLDYNSWIDKVDASWQGDIPATIIFNNSKKLRHFHSGELDADGLKKMINEYL